MTRNLTIVKTPASLQTDEKAHESVYGWWEADKDNRAFMLISTVKEDCSDGFGVNVGLSYCGSKMALVHSIAGRMAHEDNFRELIFGAMTEFLKLDNITRIERKD